MPKRFSIQSSINAITPTNHRHHQSCLFVKCLQYPSIHHSIRMTTNQSIQSLNIAKQSNNNNTDDNNNNIICKNIKIIGWVQSVRKHKSRVFCNISDGTSPYDLQATGFHHKLTSVKETSWKPSGSTGQPAVSSA
ncbi:unnamed protein product [Trichobilharzia regenti]|nr:unnamed protein product [Trichobilharzia regenti]